MLTDGRKGSQRSLCKVFRMSDNKKTSETTIRAEDHNKGLFHLKDDNEELTKRKKRNIRFEDKEDEETNLSDTESASLYFQC